MIFSEISSFLHSCAWYFGGYLKLDPPRLVWQRTWWP